MLRSEKVVIPFYGVAVGWDDGLTVGVSLPDAVKFGDIGLGQVNTRHQILACSK
jgi:hypothetical protein